MKNPDPIQQTIEAALKEAELQLSKDAILGAATSLAGIVAVLQYERLAVVSSKAFGLIMKVKPF